MAERKNLELRSIDRGTKDCIEEEGKVEVFDEENIGIGEKGQEKSGTLEKSNEKGLEVGKGQSINKIPNTVNCTQCKLLMGYPSGSYFITCPQCKTVTPTMDLLPLNCQFCKLASYFPKGSPTVQCNCGAIYSTC